MNEKPNWSSEANQDPCSVASPQQEPISITLQLPSALAVALHERSQQTGLTQAEIILDLLQTACGLASTQPTDPYAAQMQTLLERLNQLEVLMPRLETIEGKLIAF